MTVFKCFAVFSENIMNSTQWLYLKKFKSIQPNIVWIFRETSIFKLILMIMTQNSTALKWFVENSNLICNTILIISKIFKRVLTSCETPARKDSCQRNCTFLSQNE